MQTNVAIRLIKKLCEHYDDAISIDQSIDNYPGPGKIRSTYSLYLSDTFIAPDERNFRIFKSLNELKEFVEKELLDEGEEQMKEISEEIMGWLMNTYREGFIDGVKCFAHWHDGIQYVGVTGMKLNNVISVLERHWSFRPTSAIKEVLENDE